ncbi:MAG: hypothetical protein COA50_08335 [Flavobacteriaceae bacterium]|nr:MAG: hypothetical protein COA50_08335 [Flavobacteriaceae bacterium]
MDSLKKERNRFSKILAELENDFSFLEEWPLHKPYNSSKWELKKYIKLEYFEYSFTNHSDPNSFDMDSLLIFIKNPNFISLHTRSKVSTGVVVGLM